LTPGTRVRVNATYPDVPDNGEDAALVGKTGVVVEDALAGPTYVAVRLDHESAKERPGYFLPKELDHIGGRRLVVKRGDTTTIFEGDFTFEVEDLDTYVQVKTGGYGRLTYRDLSGTLAKGDHVLVPLGWQNTESVGKVVAIGRGSYKGDVKNVIARLNREELAA
jgi:hypothetical protein